MLRIALKSLLHHKLRMALTAFSIVLGVGFVAGSYIFTDSMSATFEGIFDQAYGSVDVIVQPKSEEFAPPGGSSGFSLATLPTNLVDSLQKIDGVKTVESEASGLAQIITSDGTIAAMQGAPSIGSSWSENPDFNPLKIREGRPPTAPKEVVIDANTADNQKITIGDSVSIMSTGPAEEFTVVGVATFGSANSLAGASLAVFEFQEAQRFFGLNGGVTRINATSDGSISPEELKTRIESALPDTAEAITGDQAKSNDLDELNQALGFLNTALLAFAGISIFVGAFIIQNTFRIIVAQRSKELALFRALGAMKRQVIRIVIYEAFFVSVFASAIGILAGIGISSGLRAVLKLIGVGLPEGPLTLEGRTIVVSFAVGIIVTLISALMPAIKASRVSPVEAMRDQESSAPRKSLRRRAITGLVVTGFGAALMLFGLFRDIKDPVYYVGAGAAVLFIGVSVIAPLLSRPFATMFGKPIELYYGIIGRIAGRNAKRSPRRTAATASALMIGVSLVTFASIFASSAKATVDKVVADSFPGDITLTSKNQQTDPYGATIPTALATAVRNLDEIEQVSELKYDFVKLYGEQQLIVAVDPNTLNSAFDLKPVNNNYDKLTYDSVYINSDELMRRNLSIGDSIDVEYAKTGTKSLVITGTFEEAFDSPYIISIATFTDNFNDKGDLLAVANVKSEYSIEDGKNAINEVLKNYPIAQAQDKNDLVNQARTQIDQVLGLLSALLGFAILIAVLGIANTLTLSVTERTREIGMLRAIGMTRQQVRRMIRAESVIIAVFGAILGVVMGLFFGWAIIKSLEETGFTTLSIPVVQIVVYLFMAALAGVIAAIFPSYKASRMNILKAISHE